MNKLIEEGLEFLNLKNGRIEIRFFSQSCFPIYKVSFLDENKPIAVKILDREDMALSEFSSLRYLKEKKCSVPTTYGIYTKANQSLLYMDFISERQIANRKELLLNSLRQMYSIKGAKWGFGEGNFIGALQQKNSFHESFESFFWLDRIEPQLKLGIKKNRIELNLLEKLETLIFQKNRDWNLNSISPTLIHGDLWSGNVLFADKAYFVDPSISYAHPEQDLAMLELFGSQLSRMEVEDFLIELGCSNNFSERIPFWQIYPLLVHVNLFGGTYANEFYKRVEFYD